MGYKVGLTDAAIADLGAVVRFLAENSSEVALRMGEELLDAALSLSVMPRRGSPVRLRPGMRKLSCRHFLIFYRIDEAAGWVEIVRIWDGRRDPARLQLP